MALFCDVEFCESGGIRFPREQDPSIIRPHAGGSLSFGLMGMGSPPRLT